MRADRVLALLLLLQGRGRMSAGALAERLEVSRRTVYRDVEALAMAGVPVAAEPGRAGGVYLLEGWRTDLTGLTEPEVEALFMSATGPALERAMGKLAAALPAEGAQKAGRIRERQLVDSKAWGHRGSTPDQLRTVQDAVFADRRLRLRYRRAEAELVERVVDPLGLVLKSGTWYLLALVGASQRTFRLSRVESAEALDEPARRPARFDLARAWREQTAGWDAGRSDYPIAVTAEGDNLALLLRVAGDRVIEVRDRVVRLAFPGLEPAAAFVAQFGSRVEAIEPAELRLELQRRGRELTGLYGAVSRRPATSRGSGSSSSS
jgi:predicted DNA-binding transcriptional regulator YafY